MHGGVRLLLSSAVGRDISVTLLSVWTHTHTCNHITSTCPRTLRLLRLRPKSLLSASSASDSGSAIRLRDHSEAIRESADWFNNIWRCAAAMFLVEFNTVTTHRYCVEHALVSTETMVILNDITWKDQRFQYSLNQTSHCFRVPSLSLFETQSQTPELVFMSV